MDTILYLIIIVISAILFSSYIHKLAINSNSPNFTSLSSSSNPNKHFYYKLILNSYKVQDIHLTFDYSMQDLFNLPIESYKEPIPVGYGASSGNDAIYINVPNDYKFYLPQEGNKYISNSAHRDLILFDSNNNIVYTKFSGITVNIKNFIDYYDDKQAVITYLLNVITDLEATKKYLSTTYYNSSRLIGVQDQIILIESYLEPFRNTYPELFI